jgi:Zn finger protein HypA/HybF involved in hydrogenase expression
MTDRLGVVFRLVRRVYDALADPLRVDPDANQFRLSIPEAQTTTIDGDVGWGRRPPARLRCPRCEARIDQHDSRADIDCPRCVAEFSHEEFPDLELECLVCPVCGDSMEHGQRHPNRFDVPEWATCHSCRYHWDFKHSY